MANQRHDAAFVVGAVLGSVAGAAYGLYNAPQAGWRTRADLSGLVEKLGDGIAHRLAIVTTEVRHLAGDDRSEPLTAEPGFYPTRDTIEDPVPGSTLPREGVTTA